MSELKQKDMVLIKKWNETEVDYLKFVIDQYRNLLVGPKDRRKDMKGFSDDELQQIIYRAARACETTQDATVADVLVANALLAAEDELIQRGLFERL